jgi:hypothetical protein
VGLCENISYSETALEKQNASQGGLDAIDMTFFCSFQIPLKALVTYYGRQHRWD